MSQLMVVKIFIEKKEKIKNKTCGSNSTNICDMSCKVLFGFVTLIEIHYAHICTDKSFSWMR